MSVRVVVVISRSKSVRSSMHKPILMMIALAVILLLLLLSSLLSFLPKLIPVNLLLASATDAPSINRSRFFILQSQSWLDRWTVCIINY